MFDVLIFILAIVLFDLVAMRFGANSRPTYGSHDDRPNW